MTRRRDSGRSPTSAESFSSCGCSDQFEAGTDIMNGATMGEPGPAIVITEGQPDACIPDAFRRYKEREVGGGRATRQPGQVRKEAALTSAVRVARQPPTY